jgi:hypothetical protein
MGTKIYLLSEKANRWGVLETRDDSFSSVDLGAPGRAFFYADFGASVQMGIKVDADTNTRKLERTQTQM